MWWLIIAAILFIVIVAGYFGFIRPGQKARTAAIAGASQNVPVAVSVASAIKADMPVYFTGLGTVTPVNTVTVKTRIDGQLMEVRFKEGQKVSEGDVLAIIDRRPFEVQLVQAEGQLARDESILKNAELDLERYRILWEQQSIPKQQLDTQESLVRQYKGVIKSDRGAIENAKLNLAYCRITAPVAGRVGLRLVDKGNIVHAADQNGLLVITQVQPITVVFTLPEATLSDVLEGSRKGMDFPVLAYDRELKNKLADGTLSAIDNQVDTATGTVKFRASFPNSRDELFPNQFVNARLLARIDHGVIVIPAAAIQRGPEGIFVYVVGADGTVAIRGVEIGIIEGGQASVKRGINEGETVVTDGAERLKPGARVSVGKPGAKGTPKEKQ